MVTANHQPATNNALQPIDQAGYVPRAKSIVDIDHRTLLAQLFNIPSSAARP